MKSLITICYRAQMDCIAQFPQLILVLIVNNLKSHIGIIHSIQGNFASNLVIVLQINAKIQDVLEIVGYSHATQLQNAMLDSIAVSIGVGLS